MSWLNRFIVRMRMLLQRGSESDRLDSELRFHLDRQIAENVAAGMSADEARAAAMRAFGNPVLLREQTRATWSWASLDPLWRDLRYSARTLRRAPGFTLIAILVMALGIGANVALFTVVRGILLKPLPFPDPDRLLMLYESGLLGTSPASTNVVAGGVYAEWKKENRSFSRLALVQNGQDNLSATGGELPEKVDSAECTWDLFRTLGVPPALGRDFTAADDSPAANGTVILSWSLWKRRFGADPAIVGKSIYMNAVPYTVIGVMPAWFAFPESTTQLWTPVYHAKPPELMAELDNHMFRAIGRLKPGATQAQAIADLGVISRRLHDAHLNDPFILGGANARPLLEHMVGDIKEPLYILLAATCCLLLIACLNVANLLVARAVARRKELAIRTAMGGGWLRLVRERLMESLLLSAGGGALGLVLADAALGWLVRTRTDMSRIDSVHIDGVVAAFTVGVIVVCALFAGLTAAYSVSGKQILNALHEGARAGSSRAALRKVLLTVEVGLTVMLLIGAGLLLKSYERLRASSMGCATQNVLTMQLLLPHARYKAPADRANFFDALLTRVRALPGVESAGFVTAVPGQGYWGDWGFTIVEHPPLPEGKGLFALNRWADPGYFQAMGIPLLRGHTFDSGQRLDKANEVLITQLFAQKYFPGEDPIGKHIHVGLANFTAVIVGVVGDTRYSVGEDPLPMQYYPLYAGVANNGTLVIRSTHDVESLAIPVQRAIGEIDRDLPVSDVLTMDQLLGQSTLDQSFDATLLTAFAALSLLLAAAGLFGVLSYVVAQRTTEIGIRMALGAQREQVMRGMLLDGMGPALFGLLLGLAASVEASRLMRDLLYQVQPLDPAVFAAVAATLLVVSMFACLLPAWRASRLNPMQALRRE